MNKHTRDKFKKVQEKLLEERCLIPQGDDKNNTFKELSIAVLDCDLRVIKNNPGILNKRNIRKLDKYFDKICLTLKWNSDIFKNFIRKL